MGRHFKQEGAEWVEVPKQARDNELPASTARYGVSNWERVCRQPTFDNDTMSTSIRTNNKKEKYKRARATLSYCVHIPELAFSHHPRVRFQIPLPVGVLEMQEERQPVLGNRVGVVVGVEVGLV